MPMTLPAACSTSVYFLRSHFTGKERDAETGLDFFGARYFSATQGRFTSPDEFPGGIVDPFTGHQVGQPRPLPYADITDPQRLNRYAYVRNNPLRYRDPDGHCIENLCVGEALVVTAAATAAVNYMNSPQGQESIRATLTLAGTALNKAADALGNVIFNQETSGAQPNNQTSSGQQTEPGSYAPDRPLPVDPRTGNAMPETNKDGSKAGPHMQLGTKGSSNPKAGKYTQGREFDVNGERVKDVDFTDHGRPKQHPNPQQHRYDPKRESAARGAF